MIGYFLFFLRAKKTVQRRDVSLDGRMKTFYICNYGIPNAGMYYSLKNQLFENRNESIKHAYRIYKMSSEKKER